MKKKILVLIMLLIFPINVLAYSNYIIPGGETLGIEINTKGVMIIGFYPINGNYNKGNPIIKSGDYIIKIDNQEVNNVKELSSIVEKNVDKGYIDVTLKREESELNSRLDLVKDGDIYKTGLYVKDTITGIGTLSYIDPETRIFGTLGHEIVEGNTNKIVEIKTGKIFRNYITTIERSTKGVAGSKNAKFYYDTIYGKINKNTGIGVYGIYNNELPDKELLEIAKPHTGNAKILTVLSGENIEEFTINITHIDDTNDVKNISFTITDESLLQKTGGVIQGMSGSPIIQDNKIVGAVTHVVVDKPTTGYGLFIAKMLEMGEK